MRMSLANAMGWRRVRLVVLYGRLLQAVCYIYDGEVRFTDESSRGRQKEDQSTKTALCPTCISSERATLLWRTHASMGTSSASLGLPSYFSLLRHNNLDLYNFHTGITKAAAHLWTICPVLCLTSAGELVPVYPNNGLVKRSHPIP